MYKCAVYCVDGYIKDRRGCTTCKCRHDRKSSCRNNNYNSLHQIKRLKRQIIKMF
jgi:hypothetical protein